ncbi:MAG: calcium-binding protein [Acidimicrobiia bacterium]
MNGESGQREPSGSARSPRRLVFVIPHFYELEANAGTYGSGRDERDDRVRRVHRCISALHETFGLALGVAPGVRIRATMDNVVDVVVVTTRGRHLVADLEPIASLFQHREVDLAPLELGFGVYPVFAELAGRYDYYCYLDDDLVIRDPLLFDKLAWFTSEWGDDSLLQPNRYETSGGHKVYPDGPLPPEATARIRQPAGPPDVVGRWFGSAVRFERPGNPHSACFFLNAAQLDRLRAWPGYGQHTTDFVGPIESWATLPIASVFRVYKAAPPSMDVFEIEHQGSRYLDEWGIPDPAHVATAARLAAEIRLFDVETRLRHVEGLLGPGGPPSHPRSPT